MTRKQDLEKLVEKYKEDKSKTPSLNSSHPIINKFNFNRMTEEQLIEFRKWENILKPQLSQCKSPEEIQELFFTSQEANGKIPGIGGDSIIAYSYHYAYLHDMPISSCCCLCLLSKRMKNNVKKAGISNVDKVSDVRKNFVEFSSLTDYEVVDFIRRHSTKI